MNLGTTCMSSTVHNECSLLCISGFTPIAFSADHAPVVAAAMHKLHSGGNSRGIRFICVVSVATAELPTDIK